ncbi:thioredoxin-disulfide reductase [bacterium]|nr:MAG: thioredoxin-disulfide reductase [bacterium]
MANQLRKLIIIGSGPAGLTAAIYASRADLAPLVITGREFGGQLMTTTEVGNFPGFVDDIMGPELIKRMADQAKRYGTELVMDDVTKVDFTTSPFRIWTNDEEYQTAAVIIATGASVRWLGLESETKLRGKGVSACATCDGFFFRGKRVLVIGGGDAAMEEANFLTRFSSEVTVVHRSDTLRASKIMQKRALDNPKIKFVWDSEVLEILGQDGVTGARVKNIKTGAESVLEAEGVFVAIGHVPNTKFLQGSNVELDHKGYIVVQDGSRTNVEGVFVAGDVHDHIYRQAITAAGAGCRAAIDAEHWLAGKN